VPDGQFLVALHAQSCNSSEAPPIPEAAMRAQDLIHKLSLKPHPEGGWYREVYRSPTRVRGARGERAAVTTIYYLLERQQLSRWHVVDADEIWHFYGGAGLELLTYDPSSKALVRHTLGDPEQVSEPVAVVPAGAWQAARSLGEYALVGCSVAPGFEFTDFRFVSDLADHERHFTGDLEAWRILL
jgi:predicted cupin superfamily sugar epimerase